MLIIIGQYIAVIFYQTRTKNHKTGFVWIIFFYLTMYGNNVQCSQPVGGHGGHPHEFMQPTYSLVAIRGGAGAALDSIQCLFKDINSGQFVESPRWGGGGGNQYEYQAPPGAWIDRVFITTRGNVVASI